MNRMMLVSFVLILNFAFSQVAKDTSYTITSEYKKQIQKFPFIEIVESSSHFNVVAQYDLVYHTVSNRDLHLDAYLFQSQKELPIVVLIHGGGWKSGNKSLMKPLAQTLSQKGFQCFAIEYRLSGEAIYPAAIEDVLHAIDYIKNNAKKFSADAQKIAILGCSSGGQMASLIGTKFYTQSKAIVNLDGILAFHHPQSQEGKMASQWLGGAYHEKPEIWNEASALTHVSSKTPPTLFINSQFERFHAGRDEMIAKMNTFKIDSKVETIPESPHTFWLFHPWFDLTSQYIISFLNDKLKS